MNIQAILFMCNDFSRANFVLDNFCKHNPDIPITTINSGGEPPEKHLNKYDQNTIINCEDLWHKGTHCGRGGFGLKYVEKLFEFGLNKRFTHTLYLETDVLTNSKITQCPKYDLSGVFVTCGPKENFLWKYFNIKDNHYHTGCGGTIFSYTFFDTIYSNYYHLFYDVFKKFPENFYVDLIITLIARYANLTVGPWEEVSDLRSYWNGNVFVPGNSKNTLVHGYKI